MTRREKPPSETAAAGGEQSSALPWSRQLSGKLHNPRLLLEGGKKHSAWHLLLVPGARCELWGWCAPGRWQPRAQLRPQIPSNLPESSPWVLVCLENLMWSQELKQAGKEGEPWLTAGGFSCGRQTSINTRGSSSCPWEKPDGASGGSSWGMELRLRVPSWQHHRLMAGKGREGQRLLHAFLLSSFLYLLFHALILSQFSLLPQLLQSL